MASYAPVSVLSGPVYPTFPYPGYPHPYQTIGAIGTVPSVVYVQRPGYVVYGTTPWWGGYPVWPGWRIPGPMAVAHSSSSSSSSTRIRV